MVETETADKVTAQEKVMDSVVEKVTETVVKEVTETAMEEMTETVEIKEVETNKKVAETETVTTVELKRIVSH